MENKRKHLEFIQGVITRMAGNLFFLRGWTITLLAALLALFMKGIDSEHMIYLLVLILIFLTGCLICQASSKSQIVKFFEDDSGYLHKPTLKDFTPSATYNKKLALFCARISRVAYWDDDAPRVFGLYGFEFFNSAHNNPKQTSSATPWQQKLEKVTLGIYTTRQESFSNGVEATDELLDLRAKIGFKRINHLRTVIVVSFRGTASARDVVTDLRYFERQYGTDPSITVHRGILTSAEVFHEKEH